MGLSGLSGIPGGLGACACNGGGKRGGLGELRFLGFNNSGIAIASDDRTGVVYRVSQPPGGWPKVGDFLNESRIISPANPLFDFTAAEKTTQDIPLAPTTYAQDFWRSLGYDPATGGTLVKNVYTGQMGTASGRFEKGESVPNYAVVVSGSSSGSSAPTSSFTPSPGVMASSVPGGSSPSSVGAGTSSFNEAFSLFSAAFKPFAQATAPVALEQLSQRVPGTAPYAAAIQPMFAPPSPPEPKSSGPGMGTILLGLGGATLVGGLALGIASRRKASA